MQLSVSNLAWPEHETDWCLSCLDKFGIKGVEIAPLKMFSSWQSINDTSIEKVKQKLACYNVQVSSFQAITYGVNDIALQGDVKQKQNLLTHFSIVAELLKTLGGDYAVFGSPGLRREAEFNTEDLAKVLYDINHIFETHQVKFALETVPEYYGCNVLNNILATDSFLSDNPMSNVVRHFDTGCQFLSSDLREVNQCIKFIEKCKHLHISQQDLADFSTPSLFNKSAAPWIKEHYKGKWCVLEMGDKYFSRDKFCRSLENFVGLFSVS